MTEILLYIPLNKLRHACSLHMPQPIAEYSRNIKVQWINARIED
jgi:hypothetical protein